jgi:hypothetical protein
MKVLRSLLEIRCLSQGLPHGMRCPLLLPPKAVKHPPHGISRLWYSGGRTKARLREDKEHYL